MEGIEARINRLSLHHIGNPNKEGELILSENQVPISAEMEELLWKYLIEGFDENGYYTFAGESGNPALNSMYMLAGEIFKEPENFHLRGREMAEYLFDNTHRKSTKDGDLFLVYLRDLRIDDEVTAKNITSTPSMTKLVSILISIWEFQSRSPTKDV